MAMLQLRKQVRANAVLAILSRVLQALARSGSGKAASVSRKVRVLEYFLRVFRPQMASIFNGRAHIDFYSHILINVAREDMEDIQDIYELLLEQSVSEYPGGCALAARVLDLLQSGPYQRYDYSYFIDVLKSFTEKDESLDALQSALYDTDPVPGLVKLISLGTCDLQIVNVFLERFGQRISTFNLQTLLFCVLQQLGPADKYQGLRAVLVYQLATRIDGVPGLNFDELEPLLRRFWDIAQLEPYAGSVNAVV